LPARAAPRDDPPAAIFGKDGIGRHVVPVVAQEQQVAVRDRIVRPHFQRLTAAILGLGMPALRLQRDRQVGEHAVPLRRPRQCRAMMTFRLDRTTRPTQQCTQRFMHLGIVGANRKCLPERRLGAIRFAACHLAERKTAQQPGPIRCATQRLDQHVARLGDAMQVQQDVAQVSQRRHQRWIDPQRLPVGCLGFLQMPARAQQHAEIRQNRRIRHGIDRTLQKLHRRPGIAPTVTDQAGDMQRGGVARIARQQPFSEAPCCIDLARGVQLPNILAVVFAPLSPQPAEHRLDLACQTVGIAQR